MGHSNNIISIPSIDFVGDIAYVLGSVVEDRGNLVRMIANGNINPWAKYKPVRLSVVDKTGRTSGSTYWQAADKKCGFAFTSYTEFGSPNSQPDTFAKLLYNSSLDWSYEKPRGVATYNEPCRSLDFDGYNHAAECPLGDVASTTVYLQQSGSDYLLNIDFDYNTPVTYGLNLSEISADGGSTYLSSWYLGILLYNGTTWWAVTSTTALGSNGYSMSCVFPASGVGSWQCVPFLSKNQISITDQGVANGSFASFYNKHRFTLTIALGTVTITPSAMWEGVRSISWEVVVDNNDGSSKTFHNPSVKIQKTESPDSPAGGTEIITKSLSNFTVSGGDLVTLSSDTLGLITPNEDYDDDYTYWVKFACDDQGYSTSWEQMEQYIPM